MESAFRLQENPSDSLFEELALVIAYEDALAEIKLANSFSAANAGPPTTPPEARQMPGTM
jgi:hypothetical protein